MVVNATFNNILVIS